MWLGEEAKTTGKILSIEEFKSRNKGKEKLSNCDMQDDLLQRRKQGSNNFMAMNYLRVKHEKEYNELPSNKDLVGTDYAPEYIIMKTKVLFGDQEAIANLTELKKRGEDGVMVPAYTQTEVFVKILKLFIIRWSFTDIETGEPYEVNEDNIRSLTAEDFTYISTELNKILESANPENKEEITPKTSINEEEKK